MAAKPKGKCPFCEEAIIAEVVEENSVRRDRCACPTCKAEIYVCRVPGCHDYAKGSPVYDHELCPDCTKRAEEALSATGKHVIPVLVTALLKKRAK